MITSFYSFKGGVGRTLAVAHLGWTLARRRRDANLAVLVVDMDFEAPGLDRYFRFPGAEGCTGLAGLAEAWQAQPEGSRAGWLRGALDRPSPFALDSPHLPNLRFLPSGLLSHPDKYSGLVAFLRREMDAQPRVGDRPSLASAGFLGDLRAALASVPYVLIDSRTGLTDSAFVSTILLADVLVVCVRLNLAHLEGVEPVLGSFLVRDGVAVDDAEARYVVAVTPVPSRGGTDLQQWLGVELPKRYRRRDAETASRGTVAPPLQFVDAMVRLYEEPFLEIGNLDRQEKLLVDEAGDALPGFDQDVPLARGYQTLGSTLIGLNFKVDPEGAKALSAAARSKGKRASTLYYWEQWAASGAKAFEEVVWDLRDVVGSGPVDDATADAAERAVPRQEGPDAESGALLDLSLALYDFRDRGRRRGWTEKAVELAVQPSIRSRALRERARLRRGGVYGGVDAQDRSIDDLREAVRLAEAAALDNDSGGVWRSGARAELSDELARQRLVVEATEAIVEVPLSELPTTLLLWVLARWDLEIRLHPRNVVAASWLYWPKFQKDLTSASVSRAGFHGDVGGLRRALNTNKENDLAVVLRTHLLIIEGGVNAARSLVPMLGDPVLVALLSLLLHEPSAAAAVRALRQRLPGTSDFEYIALIAHLQPDADALDRLQTAATEASGAVELCRVLFAIALYVALQNPPRDDARSFLSEVCAAFPLAAAHAGAPRAFLGRLLEATPMNDEQRRAGDAVLAIVAPYTLPPEPETLEPLAELPMEELRSAAAALEGFYKRAERLARTLREAGEA